MSEPAKLIGQMFGLRSPEPWKSKKATPVKTTNDDLMVGLELEIENIHEGQGWYMDRAGHFWTVEEDGSLRPRGGAWEFISKPAHLSLALGELAVFFDKFKFDERNYSDRCSVHVHTNVQDFTQEQLSNLAMVYPVFEGVLFQYVNHHKKQEEQGYCRDTNLYCIPWSDCRMNKNFVDTLFNAPAKLRNWQKYTALNLLPILDKGTVEWRHLHGTADMEKITTWLNIIGSIMKFSKENAFEDIVKTIKVLNDVSTYQQFFNAVLQNTLPYSEEYRQPMAEGVVNAKYSLMNWEANKGKPTKTGVVTFDYDAPVDIGGWNEPRAAEFNNQRLQRIQNDVVRIEALQAARDVLFNEAAPRWANFEPAPIMRQAAQPVNAIEDFFPAPAEQPPVVRHAPAPRRIRR